MKRSRLGLFRATSMTISLLGILMVIITVGIFVYVGVQGISNKVSSNVDSGSAYDELAALKSEYSSLNAQYNSVKTQVSAKGNKNLTATYSNAELELVKAGSAISDVESALSANKPSDEVNNRISIARSQLETAKTNLSNLQGMM